MSHLSPKYLQISQLKHQRDGALRILLEIPCDQPLRPPDSSIGSVCKAAAAAAAIAADGNADSDKCLMCDRGDLMAAGPLPVSAMPPDGPARSIELPVLLILDPVNPPGFLPSPGSCKFTKSAHFDTSQRKASSCINASQDIFRHVGGVESTLGLTNLPERGAVLVHSRTTSSRVR